MVEQRIDHGRNQEREIDPLAFDGGQRLLDIEASHEVDRPSAPEQGQEERASCMAVGRDAEIARHARQLIVTQGCEKCEGAGGPLEPDRALCPSGRATGIVDHRDIIGPCPAERRRAADRVCKRDQVRAKIGAADREDVDVGIESRKQVGRTVAMTQHVNDEAFRARIGHLIDVVRDCILRVQGCYTAAQRLRGNGDAPGFEAVIGEDRDDVAILPPARGEHRLESTDEIEGRAVAEAVRLALECHTVRKTPQGEQRLGAEVDGTMV